MNIFRLKFVFFFMWKTCSNEWSGRASAPHRIQPPSNEGLGGPSYVLCAVIHRKPGDPFVCGPSWHTRWYGWRWIMLHMPLHSLDKINSKKMSVSFFGLKMLLLFSLMRNNLFWCAKERRGWSDGLNYRTASHFIPTTTISIRVHPQPKRELAHYDLGKFLGIGNGNSDSAFLSPFVCIPPLVPCPG